MGYVYYGHYPHWFERARSFFIRKRGLSYDAVEARGIWLPVRDMNFLKNWLVGHIKGTDRKYAPFFKERGL